MKKTLLIIALTISALTAQASLIDLTPGGFQAGNPPPVYVNWLVHNWQHSAFALPESLFTVNGAGDPSGTISWDLTGTGYTFHWLFVIDANDPTTVNMYQVRSGQIISGDGEITIDGLSDIYAVYAYGTLPEQVPDGGSTAWFSAAGLVILGLFKLISN